MDNISKSETLFYLTIIFTMSLCCTKHLITDDYLLPVNHNNLLGTYWFSWKVDSLYLKGNSSSMQMDTVKEGFVAMYWFDSVFVHQELWRDTQVIRGDSVQHLRNGKIRFPASGWSVNGESLYVNIKISANKFDRYNADSYKLMTIGSDSIYLENEFEHRGFIRIDSLRFQNELSW